MTDEEKFNQLLLQWEYECRYISSSSVRFNFPEYHSIVAMGWKAVPFALFWMPKYATRLTVVMAAITGENPIKAHMLGRSYEITEAWKQWAELNADKIKEKSGLT